VEEEGVGLGEGKTLKLGLRKKCGLAQVRIGK